MQCQDLVLSHTSLLIKVLFLSEGEDVPGWIHKSRQVKWVVKSRSSYTLMLVKQPYRFLRAGFSGVNVPHTTLCRLTPMDVELSGVCTPKNMHKGLQTQFPLVSIQNHVTPPVAAKRSHWQCQRGRIAFPAPNLCPGAGDPQSRQKSEKGIRENRRDRPFGAFLGESSAEM